MNFVKKTLLTLLLGLSLVFVSCDNFFNGALVQEELQELIEDANAPEIDIFISADADTGTVSPNGIVTHKVGKSFPVIFKEAKGYQFLYWEVLDKTTGAVITDAIKITDAKDSETRFTLLTETSGLSIHPVCAERLAVNSFIPANEETGVSKDSSIVITFNKNLSKENDFSKIDITSNGEVISNYYLKPVVNENTLTFSADKKNLIPVTGTKNIEVLIPAGLFYEVNNTPVTIGTETKNSFKINNSTNITEQIVFSVAKEKGSVTPEGAKKIKINESVNIKYEPKDDYVFNGWSILDGEGKEVPETFVKFENKNAESTSITVLGSLNGVTIVPKAKLITKVVATSPKQDSVNVDCDQKITVTFNKTMDAALFNYSANGAVRITSKGVDISEYYKAPQLLEDGKTLLLAPNPETITNIFEGADTADVLYTIKNTAKDNVAGENLSLKEDYSFTIRLTTNKETVKPEFAVFNIAKTREDAINGTNLLSKTEFENFTAADSESNYVRSLWIYCKAKDSGGPVKSILTKETLIYTTDKRTVSEPVAANSNGYGSFTDLNNDYHEAIFEYNFECTKDGVVNISFQLCDYAGCKSNEINVYEVIKDSTISLDFLRFGTNSPGNTGIPVNNMTNRKVYIQVNETPKGRIYSKGTTVDKNYKLTVLAGVDEQNLQVYETYEGIFSDPKINFYNNKNNYLTNTSRVFYINRDVRYNTKVRLLLQDNIGNETYKDYSIPKYYPVLGYYKDNENPKKLYVLFNSNCGLNNGADLSDKLFVYERKDLISNSKERVITSPSGISENDFYALITFSESYTKGIYSFYTIPKIQNLLYNSVSIYGDMEEKSPYEIYWNGEQLTAKNSEIDIQASELPSFTLKTTPASNNKKIVNIIIPESYNFKNGINYIVKIEKNTDPKISYTDEFNFYVDNTEDYKISIMAITPGGNKLETLAQSLQKNNAVSTGPKYNDFEKFTAYPYGLRHWDIPENNTGIVDFNYYFASMTSSNSDLRLTKENVIKLKKHINNFDYSKKLTRYISSDRFDELNYDDFYYDGEVEGYYRHYVQILDNAGNECYQEAYYIASNIIDKQSPKITVDNDKLHLQITCNQNVEKVSYLIEGLTNGSWKEKGTTNKNGQDYTDFDWIYNDMGKTGNTFDSSDLLLPFYENPKDSNTALSLDNFLRINLQWYDSENIKNGNFSKNGKFFYTTYVCPSYLKNKPVLKQKTYLEAPGTVTVLCDNPTLVHTMYCSKNYYDDAKMWTTAAIEAGVVQESVSFDYTIPLEKIPAGYYYTTVIHFADGEIAMTDVKVK